LSRKHKLPGSQIPTAKDYFIGPGSFSSLDRHLFDIKYHPKLGLHPIREENVFDSVFGPEKGDPNTHLYKFSPPVQPGSNILLPSNDQIQSDLRKRRVFTNPSEPSSESSISRRLVRQLRKEPRRSQQSDIFDYLSRYSRPLSYNLSQGNYNMSSTTNQRAPRKRNAPSSGPQPGSQPKVRGKRSRAPSRPSVSQRGSQLVFQTNSASLEEAGWKVGLTNPSFASRGPGGSTRPTIIANYHSTTTFVVGNYDAGAFAGGNFQLDPDGNMAIILTPHIGVTNTESSPRIVTPRDEVQPLLSGFTCGGDANIAFHDINGPGSSNDWIQIMTFVSQNLPGGPHTALTELQPFQAPLPIDDYAVPPSERRYMPYRILGHRATLSCNSNATSARGNIAAGDFSDYMITGTKGYIRGTAALPLNEFQHAGNGLIAEYDDITEADYQLNLGVGFPRITNLGGNIPGAVYEASALPLNSEFWNYKYDPGTWHPAFSTTYTFGTGSFIPSSLRYQPCSVFFLRGVASGNSFTVGVDMAVEIQVDMNSPLAFLYESARFAKQYTPDLQKLHCCTPGGEVNHLALSMAAADPAVAFVLLAKLNGRDPVDEGLHPFGSGYGAVNDLDTLRRRMSTQGSFSDLLKRVKSTAMSVLRNPVTLAALRAAATTYAPQMSPLISMIQPQSMSMPKRLQIM
jgi:hypothetical protein